MPGTGEISRIRNIGIMAHIDAGKTTTTERILFYSGYLHKIGAVDEGTAFMDYMDQEKERGITIMSAATTCYWRDYQINIIDTPGHVDFTAEVQRSLRVLDGAIAIFCAVGGVEPQSETVWHQADQYSVPRIAYINKLDRTGADFGRVLGMMRDRLHARPIPMQMPMGVEDKFEGIIDLVRMKALYFDADSQGLEIEEGEIPERYQSEAEGYRAEMLEAVADANDSLLERYLAGDELTDEDIKSGVRKLTLELKGVPVFCGSSLRNTGVQPLIEGVIEYLPSPLEVTYFDGYDVEDHNKTLSRRPSDDEAFSALAFKILTDPYVGRLTFLRIYSGVVKVGQSMENASVGKKEKILKLMRVQANKREEIPEAGAGDIIAVPGLRFTRTGDTICDIKDQIIYEKIQFAEPVINQSIEARTIADQEKMIEVLQKLSEEDPSFKYSIDEDSGQMIISGVGELHLEIIVDRLLREFKVPARVGKPQVAYRESVSEHAIADGVFDKPVSGKNQYGHVQVEILPGKTGTGLVVENLLPKNLKISDLMMKAMEKGALEAMQVGPNGYTMIDVIVRLKDTRFSEEQSTELGQKIAASMAVKEASRHAKPIMLEPVFRVEIVSPEDYTGDVISDLNSRRGKIEGISQRGAMQVVSGTAPLSEMFGYVTKLRSITQGRASYTMVFSHYEPALAKQAY